MKSISRGCKLNYNIRGIKGKRKTIAGFLHGHKFHKLNQVVVFFYVLFGIMMFCIEEWLFEEISESKETVHITEFVFLFLFFLEIAMHTFAFGGLFMKDPYSILDTIVIFGNLTFISVHYSLTPLEEEKIPHPM